MFKVRVINGQYVIDVSICEVELRCQPFPTGREQGLYELNTEICRLGVGHILCPWEFRLSVGKPFLLRPQKCCQLETRAS